MLTGPGGARPPSAPRRGHSGGHPSRLGQRSGPDPSVEAAPGRPRGGRPFFATAGRPCGGRAALGRGASPAAVWVAGPAPGAERAAPFAGLGGGSLPPGPLGSVVRADGGGAPTCAGAEGARPGRFLFWAFPPLRAGISDGPHAVRHAALSAWLGLACLRAPPCSLAALRRHHSRRLGLLAQPAAYPLRIESNRSGCPPGPLLSELPARTQQREARARRRKLLLRPGFSPAFPPPLPPPLGALGERVASGLGAPAPVPPAAGLPMVSGCFLRLWAAAFSGLDFPRCLCYSVHAWPVPLLRGLPSGYPWTARKPLDRKAGRFFYALLAALLPTENRRSAAQDVNRKTRPPPRRIAPSEQTPKCQPAPGPKLRERGKPPLQAKQKTKLDTKTSGRRLHRLPRPTQQNLCYFVAFITSQRKAAVPPHRMHNRPIPL